MSIRLVDKFDQEDRFRQLTTDPLVTFDTLSETYEVHMGGTWCEVYGCDRMNVAHQIANLFRGGQLRVQGPPNDKA